MSGGQNKKAPGVASRQGFGLVFRVRLSPKDVMALIDLMDAAELRMVNMSLSSAIKRGIMVAVQTLLENKVIPERDGFEYSEMILPFALPAGKTIKVGHGLVVSDMASFAQDQPMARAAPIHRRHAAPSVQEERLIRRKTELLIKQDADPLNWSAGEQRELDSVTHKLLDIYDGERDHA